MWIAPSTLGVPGFLGEQIAACPFRTEPPTTLALGTSVGYFLNLMHCSTSLGQFTILHKPLPALSYPSPGMPVSALTDREFSGGHPSAAHQSAISPRNDPTVRVRYDACARVQRTL